jgi:hypothetical protein
MEALVAQAMRRWPDVPAVYGWLQLDRRGRWRIRGEPVRHPGTAGFIGRNYLADARGRWFFQNGPQRVFVDLEACPWVLSLDAGDAISATLRTHTGQPVDAPRHAWLTAEGSLLVEFESGVGLIDDRDLARICAVAHDAAGGALDEQGWAEPSTVGAFLRLAGCTLPLAMLGPVAPGPRFGFVPCPRPDPGEEACT